MKINTEKLKELVNKSIKGSSNNKMIPITQLMGISVNSDNNIVLTTTDSTNYLYVQDTIEDTDAIEVTVPVEQFSKLISKMTCTDVELTIENNSLIVTGNGTYSIELPLDENGELVKYPNPLSDYGTNIKFNGVIDVNTISTIIDTVKPSLAVVYDLPIITNYFVGNNVMATDGYKLASYDNKLFDDSDTIISSELMDLLSIIDKGPISYKMDKNILIFHTDDISIFSKQIGDVVDYPVDSLKKTLDSDFPSMCKINKQDLLNLLDRISLFVGKYDKDTINMKFDTDNITISNKSNKSVEAIEYQSSANHKSFDCIVDIKTLTTQVKAYASDVIELHYGNENSIKFVDGNITYIVALNEES